MGATSFPIFNNYNPNHFKGHKGLLENSKNLCSSVNKADIKFTAQNGMTSNSKPVLTDQQLQEARQGQAHSPQLQQKEPSLTAPQGPAGRSSWDNETAT